MRVISPAIITSAGLAVGAAVASGVAVAGASANVMSAVTFCPGIVNLLFSTLTSCPSAPVTVTDAT